MTTEPRKVGRPTKLTTELLDGICEEIKAGRTLAEAAALHHVSSGTVHRWQQDNRDVRDAIADARAAQPVPMRPVGPSAPVLWDIIRYRPDGTVEIERHYTPHRPDSDGLLSPPDTEPAPDPIPLHDAALIAGILAALDSTSNGLPRSVIDRITGLTSRSRHILHDLEERGLVKRSGQSNATRWHPALTVNGKTYE